MKNARGIPVRESQEPSLYLTKKGFLSRAKTKWHRFVECRIIKSPRLHDDRRSSWLNTFEKAGNASGPHNITFKENE